MKRIVIVCIAVLSFISLLAPSHLYAQVPCATLPPPPPGTVNVTITTDNAYLFGFGDAAGITQLSAAIENCYAADIYTCIPTGVECYNVPANLNSYIYIIAYSDDRDYQGAIAQITDGYTTVRTRAFVCLIDFIIDVR